MKPLIVHISADYPDACQSKKTRAIAALVEGTKDGFDHRVYSLNRSGLGMRSLLAAGSVTEIADDGVLASWRYAAPGGGFRLAGSMRRVADRIIDDMRSRGLKPALVQGHKLSFEGIAASQVAEAFRVPFALTLQGNTDQKVIVARPDLRPAYRRLWQEAAVIFAFAPWIAAWCERTLGPRPDTPIALPCIPAADEVIAPRATGPRLATAFHLDHWRNKNIGALARACALLRADHPELTLEIAGGGGPEAERAIDRILKSAGTSDFARRIGPVASSAMQEWLNGAAALALPSKRETFGMVFVEALLAGCPILYPRGAAVDGYFAGAPFAVGVDSSDVTQIAAGLDELLRRNAACKSELARWQERSAANFRKDAILARYAQGITGAFSFDAGHVK